MKNSRKVFGSTGLGFLLKSQEIGAWRSGENQSSKPAAPPSPSLLFLSRGARGEAEFHVTYCPQTPHAATPCVPPQLPTLRDGLCSFQRLLFPSPPLLPTLCEGAFYESKVPSMGRSKDSSAPGCDFISGCNVTREQTRSHRGTTLLARRLPPRKNTQGIWLESPILLPRPSYLRRQHRPRFPCPSYS